MSRKIDIIWKLYA